MENYVYLYRKWPSIESFTLMIQGGEGRRGGFLLSTYCVPSTESGALPRWPHVILTAAQEVTGPLQTTLRKGDFMWLDLIKAELPSLNLEGVCGGGLFSLYYLSSPFEHPSIVLAFTLFVTFSLAQSICLSVHSRNFHRKVWPLRTPQYHSCVGT